MKSICYKNSSSVKNEVDLFSSTNKRLNNVEQEFENIVEAFKVNLNAIEILKVEFDEAKKVNETVHKLLSELSLDNIYLKHSPNQNPVHLKRSIAESTSVSFKDEQTQKLIELAKTVKDAFNYLTKQIEYLKQENFNFKKLIEDANGKNVQSDSKLKSLMERLSQTEKILKKEESEKKIALSKAESEKIELYKVQEELMLKTKELNEQSNKVNDYKNLINDLEKKKAKVEEEKFFMAKKIDKFESKYEKSLNNEKEKYQAHIKQIEATKNDNLEKIIKELQGKNDNLEKIIMELQEKNEKLVSECQDYKHKIKLRDQDLQEFEKEREEIKKSNFDIVSTLDEENKKYKKEISQYESRYQGGFSNLDEKKINEELLATLSKEIEDNKAKIKATQINNVAIVTKVKEITEECDSLKNIKNDLEKRLYHKDNEIYSLKTLINVYKDENIAQKEIKILTDERESLLKELEILTKEKDVIQKKLNEECHKATSAEYYRKIIEELEKKNNYY